MQLFYAPNITDNQYILSEEESKHCIKVLRLKIDDRIYLTNGRGSLYEAKIIDSNYKKCILHILSKKKDYRKKKYKIHIAIAPTKSIDRFEWFLEKSTEIGIDEISPVLCMQSERKVIKPERLEKVILAAMKQSLIAYKPNLNQLVTFDEFLKQPHQENKFIAHCQADDLPSLKSQYPLNSDALVLIGPEGDFSKQEIDTAQKKGFIEVSLGSNRLRTETAGFVSCHMINLLNES